MFKRTKYYTDCSIPLSLFIKILDSGNVKLLLISGRTRLKKLEKAWSDIFQEYDQTLNSKRSAQFLNNLKYITSTEIRLDLLKNSLKALSYNYDLKLIRFIKSLGIRTNIQLETFEKDLRVVLAEIKAMESKLSQRKKENEVEKVTNIKKEFSKLLLRLSEHFGFNFNPKNHSVYDFCEAVKMMNEDIKKTQKKK